MVAPQEPQVPYLLLLLPPFPPPHTALPLQVHLQAGFLLHLPHHPVGVSGDMGVDGTGQCVATGGENMQKRTQRERGGTERDNREGQ